MLVGGARLGGCVALLLCVAFTAAASDVPHASAARPPARPNILVIMTDDQRAHGTLGVMRKTRRLFARGGTNFTQAYATTPLCCPSRASVMTGRYAYNHRVRNNAETDNLEHASTLQRYLRDAGYFTAIVGKFLNRWDLSRQPPHFDAWAVGKGDGYYGSRWNLNGEALTVPAYNTHFVADKTVEFLEGFERAGDARPWYVFVTPKAPHAPATPEPRYAGAALPRWRKSPAMLERDRSDKPPYVRAVDVKLSKARRTRRYQLRSLMSVDDLVARVFGALRSLKERGSTLAFYMSDNGRLWGEHGMGGGALTKRPPYTASVKIPLLMRWPGHVARRARDDRLAANIDIAPTILDAAGISPAAAYPMDGMSLLDSTARRRLLLEYYRDIGPTPEWASLRTARYQYVENYGEDKLTVAFREYYDRRADLWQLRNLLGDRRMSNDPDVSRISAHLAALRSCSGDACR